MPSPSEIATAALAMTMSVGWQAEAQAQPSEIPAFFDADRLYRICSEPNAGQCSMYVSGVLDGLFYADIRRGEPRWCRTRINNREAAQAVTEWLADNRHLKKRSAAVAVRAALRDRFRC